MTIFFTADTHFNHANMIKHESRPFENIENMNKKMIEKWNNKVNKNDKIYILGDFVWCRPNEIVPELNGKKYLIRGNHDKQISEKYFEWIKDYYVLKYNKLRFVLFHYPIFRWDRCHYGDYHLYGHVHSNEKSNSFMNNLNAYNVGVDVNNYEPVSIDEIVSKLKNLNKNNY